MLETLSSRTKSETPVHQNKVQQESLQPVLATRSGWIPAARNRRSILNAGRQAARHYNPRSYPGKITLFRAAKLGGGIDHDPQMGWSRLAGGELKSHLIPGYHAHIVLEPRVRLLAKELIAALCQAQEIQIREQTLQEEPSQYKDGASVGKRRDRCSRDGSTERYDN